MICVRMVLSFSSAAASSSISFVLMSICLTFICSSITGSLPLIKGNDPVIEEQINVRHILIRTNEILDDAAAEEKLKTIRTQIIDEGDFGAVASAVSEDPGSAQDGGDMGWAQPISPPS